MLKTMPTVQVKMINKKRVKLPITTMKRKAPRAKTRTNQTRTQLCLNDESRAVGLVNDRDTYF